MKNQYGKSQRLWLGTLLLLGTALGAGCQRSPAAPSVLPAERLVTVGGPVTETVFALGRGDAVVAVDTSSVFPAEAAQRTKIGYQRTIAAEGVLALRPTRVIASEETGPPAALAQLRAAGIPVDVIPSETTLAGARKKIATIAELLGVRARGAALIAQLDAEVTAATAQPVGPPLRVLFLYARGAGTMMVAGADTNVDAMLHLAGAQNAAAALHGYKPFSAESALAENPQVLLLTSRGAQSLGGTSALDLIPGLSALPAERRPRVITQDDLLLLGFGPRTGQAIRELRAKLAAAAATSSPTALVAEAPQ